MTPFAAVQESVVGTSRHFAATQQVGRFRSEADIQQATLQNRIYEYARPQNSGGTCPTFSGPRNTAPSTKRSGKARAFLPSSSASLPSELMPAATPALAFCL